MNIHEVQTGIRVLREPKDSRWTWRDIANLPEYRGVPAATLCAIYKHGREPQNAAHRRILGLPVLGLGEICPVHGKVCAVKHRPQPTARKPRRTRKARNRWNMRVALAAAAGFLAGRKTR